MPKAVLRSGGPLESTQQAADLFTQKRLADPSYRAPAGYDWEGDHYERDTTSFMDHVGRWAPLAGLGIGGGVALGGALGGGAATSAGMSMPAATTGLAGTGFAGASGAGTMAGIGSWLGKIDPITAILGGLSLFGDDPDPFQKRQSFQGAGLADPKQSLNQVLAAIKDLASQASARGPRRLSSSVVPQGPAPISIDGIPFQIGGGMGTDPALKDPTLLQGRGPMSNPFQPGGPGQSPTGPMPGARRRNPSQESF